MLSRLVGDVMDSRLTHGPRKHVSPPGRHAFAAYWLRDDGSRQRLAAKAWHPAWVSIRYQARENAGWLAGLINALAERGAFPGYGLSLSA
jgi:hypothetical protein